VGGVPVACDTARAPTDSVPPDVVAAFGEVQPQSALGHEPPIARSRMRKKPWSTAACQAVTPTWSSLTDQVGWPSTYQRICSSDFVRSMICE
jgi:hypothetical protein